MTTSTALVRSMDDVSRFSTAIAQSGMYKDMRTAAEAAVKLGIATELGLGLVGMSTVHVVQGKPTLGYQAMLALVKRSGRYNYRITERTETRVAIDWFENGEKIGDTAWTIEEARRAGLAGKDTWKNYPRNMLTARAASEGVNTFCPDVMGGAVYTPEELGAEVDGDGNIVVHAAEIVAPEPVAVPEPEMVGVGAAPAAGTAASADASRVVVEAESSQPPSTPPPDAAEPTITKQQQGELRDAAKRAGVTWPSLQTWLMSQGIGTFNKQAELTVDAFHRCVAFCNEQTWEGEVAQIGLGEMAE